MLRVMKNKISGINNMQYLLLLFCAVFLIVAGIGNTFSYIMTKTPTLINRFLNGMNPDGDLVLQKMVSHPYGDSYIIPSDLIFTFEVNLGEEYANQVVETTHGEMTVNESGIITVTIAPGSRTTIYDIDEGTLVTVTEVAIGTGFTPDAATKELAIQKYQDNILTFHNHYAPQEADTSALTISGSKNLVGREWIEGDRFTFALEVNENGEWKNIGTQTTAYELVEVTDPADPKKTILLPKPEFDKFDFTGIMQGYHFINAGIYSFRVTETEGSLGGVTYDKAESKFDILVGDADMDGYLEIQSVTSVSANTTVEGMSVNIDFENSYAPVGSTEAVIEIQKVLEDTSGQNRLPSGFAFELYDEAGKLVTTSECTDSVGETSIRLVYQPQDAGKVFRYTLKECRAGEVIDALTYDDTKYRIQVAVRDNLDGTVSAYIYDAQAGGSVAGGSESAAGGSVSGGDVSQGDAGLPTVSGGIATVSGGDAGVGIGQSGLTIPRDATNVYQVAFTNQYDPQDALVTIKGSKILNGRALWAGEFTFRLYQTDALFVIPEGAQALGNCVNDADGAFSFGEMCFARVGDYYYVVAEDATDALGGVIYDDAKYLVTVKVRDYNGKLGNSVSITNVYGEVSDIVFVNHYQPAPVSLPVIGRKVLNGADLEEGAFRFNLCVADENYAAQGEVFQSVTNQGDGTIAFADLKFTAAGIYRYVVTEQKSTAVGMTYDDTVYGIAVDVLDPGDGQLVIERFAIMTEGQAVTEIVFENTYVEQSSPDKPDSSEDPEIPDEPDRPGEPDSSDTPGEPDNPDESITESPKTGDDSNIWLLVVVAVLSAGAVILLVVLRWRRKSGK